MNTIKSKVIINRITTLLLGGVFLMSDAEIVEFYKSMFGETF
jgi:hypothetical protein